MASYPKTGKTPESVLNILVTIMEKTPGGGATLNDIRNAYLEVKDKIPDDRTLYRNIHRINELLSPQAFFDKKNNSVKAHRGRKQSAVKKDLLAIKSCCDETGKTRYTYQRLKHLNPAETNQALAIVLSLYSQQKGILKDHFETVISSLLQQVITGKQGEADILNEADKLIYISGYHSADSKKIIRKIYEVIRAIENSKVIMIDYARISDGAEQRRNVEPYGLVCRHGSWYLVGFCHERQDRRIYHLDHIKKLKVIENSSFTKPDDLSMEAVFSHSWGIWNPSSDSNHEETVETVRIKASKGVAERFNAMVFHDSQKVKALPDGEAEVTFAVSGAVEMIPWLMSWGSSLEVIEPGWLREQMAESLRGTLKIYS